MRILVFGKTGQVARELSRLNSPSGSTMIALGRQDCDLSDTRSIGEAIRAASPGVVINTAAYTAVDRAESEPDLAWAVNVEAPLAMARACSETGSALLHISTDYVFDGAKTGGYVEEDAVNPLSVYGRTKEAGEAAIRATLERHIILRTSWVFAGHGSNFVRTMLRLSDQPRLRIVNDQAGCPTFAGDIARTLRDIAHLAHAKGPWGTFHFCDRDPTTWYHFAEAIFAAAHLEKIPQLQPIAAAEYPTTAKRPANSILDCARLARTFGILQPYWRDALPGVLAELK